MLYVPVNRYGHVGMLPGVPFYGTFTQNENVMTFFKCLKYSDVMAKNPF